MRHGLDMTVHRMVQHQYFCHFYFLFAWSVVFIATEKSGDAVEPTHVATSSFQTDGSLNGETA
jgi:hypothetical protein